MYYKLSNSIGKDIGKNYPQIQSFILLDESKSPYNIRPGIFPDFVPDLSHLVLHRNCFYTDVMSSSLGVFDLIVSNKVRNIFSSVKLPNCKFYKSTVYNMNTSRQYWCMIFFDNISQSINYRQTNFVLRELFTEDIPINILSQVDIANNVKKYPSKKIISDEIFLQEKVMYDLFYLHKGNNNIYISENLKTLLINNNVTGIDLKQANIIC